MNDHTDLRLSVKASLLPYKNWLESDSEREAPSTIMTVDAYLVDAALDELQKKQAEVAEAATRDPQDRYGRALGFCRRMPDGPSLNLAMVRAGHAVAYRHYIAGRPHEAAFIAAENEARAAMRGIWAGEFTLPWEWRAGRRGG